MTFQDLNLNISIYKALNDLGFTTPTPIQAEAFNVVASGKDVVGIAQTGTGKTFAYMLPILKNLAYSRQEQPRVLIVVPTRELVVQLVAEIEKLSKYLNHRILGVYGGTNINTQKQAITEGLDILIATPGRLYDLALTRVLQLKSIQKLVIDEVDVLLDFGFRHQLINLFDLLPERRQNIMFSATMTKEVDALIQEFFKAPKKITIAVSGTPLHNIAQYKYETANFTTKLNLVEYILQDTSVFSKVLIFIANKKRADTIFQFMAAVFPNEVSVIHANKTQNFRLQSIADFKAGNHRILIATDLMARGIDIDTISHVINFDVPNYAENYMHRIGRTGRAKEKGEAITLITPTEKEVFATIEQFMQQEVELLPFPEEVSISTHLLAEEKPKVKERNNPLKQVQDAEKGAAFHKKKEKNQKQNLGGKYRRELSKKYKKPKTRGDKNYRKRNKKR